MTMMSTTFTVTTTTPGSGIVRNYDDRNNCSHGDDTDRRQR